MTNHLYGTSLLDLTEWSPQDFQKILDLGIEMKAHPEKFNQSLVGKTLAMIFEKNSTRTRVSFESGMYQLGGHAIVMYSENTQMGRGEPIKDTAKVLSGYVDGIMIRTFSDEMVKELSEEGSIPVINGLTDLHHPCQIVADFMTIQEHKGSLKGVKLVYVGDGNNMAHSFMIGGALMGMEIVIVTPAEYGPNEVIINKAQAIAEKNLGSITLSQDPHKSIVGADVVVTDVWASMGSESEQVIRMEVFKDYQVNQTLVEKAADDFIFLHCLPAHREEEVSSEVIDGPHSVIYQEAENRLHGQKAILHQLLKK